MTSGFSGWSAVPKPPSQVVTETCGFGISCSCRVSGSGSSCVSGTTLIPRPSRARDLVTMAEVGSARLTSLERVTTGAGSVSRPGRQGETELARQIAVTLLIWRCGFHNLLSQNWRFTVTKYLIIMVPIHCTANSVFNTMQCKLQVTNRLGKQQKRRIAVQFLISSSQCSYRIGSSAVRKRSALGVENFHAAITFETQTTSISRRISQNPSRTMQIASDNRIVQRNAVQVLRATKMMTFHFREVYFTSYVDSDVSKCYFPPQSPSDLPLRSCLYDASISSYRQSKFRTL